MSRNTVQYFEVLACLQTAIINNAQLETSNGTRVTHECELIEIVEAFFPQNRTALTIYHSSLLLRDTSSKLVAVASLIGKKLTKE